MTVTAKAEVFRILDRAISKLDITKTQYEKAKQRYEAIGEWLADGEYCLSTGRKVCLNGGKIYSQGSMRLATAIRPIGQNEFDVDLVFFSPNVNKNDIEPKELNRLIGDRLREHEKYKNMMEPLKRGWRITYADEFHLDITPSINNHSEANNSEYVPDRKLQDWKDSNPRDYAEFFDKVSSQIPKFDYILKDEIRASNESHEVVNFPENNQRKPLLKRYVQILKRHRDIVFEGKEHKPISIIITTLATHSYKDCIENKNYDNELDLLIDVIRNMPKYIIEEKGKYFILNPTAIKENFAERWNEVPAKKRAFDKWYRKVLYFFENLLELTERSGIFKHLENGLGRELILSTNNEINQIVNNNRKNGVLSLSLVNSFKEPVKSNTFYGD